MARRDAFAQLSRVWEVGVNLGYYQKGRAYWPLSWPRVAVSTWAVGAKRTFAKCSNWLGYNDFPAVLALNDMNESSIDDGSNDDRRIRNIRNNIFRKRWELASWIANSSNPSATWTSSKTVANSSDWQDAEAFLGNIVLGVNDPLGPLKLTCVAEAFRCGMRRTLPVTHGLLQGRHQMKC